MAGENDILQQALLGESGKPVEAPSGDGDAEILYEEFKSAPDSKAGLAALRQLVKILK